LGARSRDSWSRDRRAFESRNARPSQFEALNEQLEGLNAQALELQSRIAQNVASLLT